MNCITLIISSQTKEARGQKVSCISDGAARRALQSMLPIPSGNAYKLLGGGLNARAASQIDAMSEEGWAARRAPAARSESGERPTKSVKFGTSNEPKSNKSD